MRVVLRADADVTHGSGHVMRVLTIAEALAARGHETILVTAPIDIPWLTRRVASSGVRLLESAPRGELAADLVLAHAPDRVVVDSYAFAASDISSLDRHVPVLMLVDGDRRGAEATLYLDQNLGADEAPYGGVDPRSLLLGSKYALVRSEVSRLRRERPDELRHEPPRLLVVIGGTDPRGLSVDVVAALAPLLARVTMTVVAQERHHAAIEGLGLGDRLVVLAPTPSLPELFAESDLVVSAAGTTAWDVCSLGIPSVLMATAANQLPSMTRADRAGVAVGVDLVDDDALPAGLVALRDGVVRLLDDAGLRGRLAGACAAAFDGAGPMRVAEALEEAAELHGAAAPGEDDR